MLAEEHDTSGLKRSLQHITRPGIGSGRLRLERPDRRHADIAAGGQVFLGPFEQRAGGAALGGGDHAGI